MRASKCSAHILLIEDVVERLADAIDHQLHPSLPRCVRDEICKAGFRARNASGEHSFERRVRSDSGPSRADPSIAAASAAGYRGAALFDRIGGLAHKRVPIACAATTADSADKLSSFYKGKPSRRCDQPLIQRVQVCVSGLKLVVEDPGFPTKSC